MSDAPPPPPVGADPSAPPYGAPPPPAYGLVVPDHPQAMLVLIFGILSVVGISVLGPVAWILGNRALEEIDASNGRIGGRSNAYAGRICGIIGTVILGLSIVGFIVMFSVFFATFPMSS